MKKVYLGLSAATGSVALVYQVLWQRYFSLLLGSDARSSTLLVAVFLLGLSCGYAFFGKLSKSFKSRREFLKLYGLVEMLIGAYALCFPLWFKFFDQVVPFIVHTLPGQLVTTILLIFIPTFGMGATIPVLTSVLPEKGEDISGDHAKIYGLNTLGAMGGVWLGVLFVIPRLGLNLGMTVMGICNILLAVTYVTNQLEGTIQKRDWVQKIAKKHELDVWVNYTVVFTSGLVGLGLEVIWFRLWGLTIGSSFLVFPMVLGIFVFGLGWGSLSMNGEVTRERLGMTILFATILMLVSYHLAPFLPYWVSHWRVLLTNLPPNYPIFYLSSLIILGVVLVPVLFQLGQLLPMAYTLLPKDGANFGARCSRLYFLNTVGTFIGSLFVGHLFLYFFNVNTLYMGLIVCLIVLWCLVSRKEITQNWLFLLLPAILLATFFIPWNRRFHVLGTFRDVAPKDYHFKGAFTMPKKEFMFLEDGPTGTASVFGDANKASISIIVNGKSDSSTVGDYPTIALLALYPYLYQSSDGPFSAAVVGLGTGVTAGILASLEKTTLVDVIEISSTVKKANDLFKNFNYDLLNNNKANIHLEDAFSFFKRPGVAYDIIISEPSNPWVTGIENLFTTYFYEISANRLKPSGIFAQWLHVYSLDNKSIATVIENMHRVFPFIRLYITQDGDVLLLAAKTKLELFPREQGSSDPILTEVLEKLSIDDINALALLEFFTESDISFIAKTTSTFVHDIDQPRLSYHALENFFLANTADLNIMIDPYVARHLTDERGQKLQAMFQKMHKSGLIERINCNASGEMILSPLCMLGSRFNSYKTWLNEKDLTRKLHAYAVLRKHRLLPKENFEESISIVEGPYVAKNLRDQLLREMIKDGDIIGVGQLIQKWELEKRMDSTEVEWWMKNIKIWEEKQKNLPKDVFSFLD